MSLIIYKNNDIVLVSNTECSCGRTSRIISNITGRVNDYVIRPDGSKISQYIFYYIMKEIDDEYSNSISKYKVIQRGNNFKLLIIPSENYKRKVTNYIRKRMYKEIDKTINIEFIFVDQIPREKSGKLRFFVREK